MNIFLSYSHDDESLARRIADELSKEGAAVWTEAELLPGDNYAEQLARALEQADAMVVLITAKAMDSRWVQREIEYALGQKQFKSRLVPLYVGGREAIDDAMVPWILRELPAVELPDPDDSDDVERATDQIGRLLAASAP